MAKEAARNKELAALLPFLPPFTFFLLLLFKARSSLKCFLLRLLPYFTAPHEICGAGIGARKVEA